MKIKTLENWKGIFLSPNKNDDKEMNMKINAMRFLK